VNGLLLGNPAGAWALLAVPALVAVHFLQERTRIFPASTLFLLWPVNPATPRGVVFRRLRSSWTLWLQVLAALLVAWVLSEPRWVHSGAWRRITLVVDDSASMGAFRARVLDGLEKTLRPFARGPVYTEWTVLAASQAMDPLYRGSSLDAALTAVRSGEWVHAEADLNRVLASAVIARGNVPGAVLWITDRQRDGLPAGVQTLAFGEPVANCGWAGLRVWKEGGETLWEAILRNWSAETQKRDWFWSDDAGDTPKESLELPPGGLITLRGSFPANTTRARLHLSADAFTLDNVLEMVAPQPRVIRVGCALAGSAAADWTRRVVATVPGAEFTQDGAVDVLVAPVNQGAVKQTGPMVLFAEKEFPVSPGVSVGGDHPLMTALDWQGLLLGAVGDLNPDVGDTVLVWRGGKALIWLGNTGGSPRLWCNFPLANSNADRLPAMVLIMGRFLSQVQASATGFCRENALAGGALPVVAGRGWRLYPASGGEESLPAHSVVRAPWKPGFFEVRDEVKKTIFEGASQFLDPRESDFSTAVTAGDIGALSGELDQQQTEADAFTELWLLLAGLAMLGAWITSTRGLGMQKKANAVGQGGRDV
jgi:hypothetical protein